MPSLEVNHTLRALLSHTSTTDKLGKRRQKKIMGVIVVVITMRGETAMDRLWRRASNGEEKRKKKKENKKNKKEKKERKRRKKEKEKEKRKKSKTKQRKT